MIQWSENLATGIQEIDRQHQEIINRVNNLYEYGTHGSEQDVIMEMLNFLETYIITHFREEERYQEECRYHKRNEHKQLHHDLERQVLELKQRAEAEGASATLITKANRMLGSWLMNHIQREDKDFAAHYRNSME